MKESNQYLKKNDHGLVLRHFMANIRERGSMEGSRQDDALYLARVRRIPGPGADMQEERGRQAKGDRRTSRHSLTTE